MPLLGLPDRAARIVGAVQDERRRAHLIDLGQRRHRVVAGAIGRGQTTEFVGGQEVPGVRRSGHAGHVADHATGHGRSEAIVAAGQVAGHVAAVAVAGDGQPLRVGGAVGDQVVERLEEVLGVAYAPVTERAIVEPLAVTVAAPRVEQQHRPTSRGQFLVVQVDIICRTVPRVVRAAVDVEQ